jgi:plasmid maintenance system antidote protein VapI
VESNPSLARVTFDTLQARLLALVNFRIRNGEFTERALARRLHVSQPQMHNVLKRQRKLQWELADALLVNLGLTVLDLLDLTSTQEQACLFNPDCRNNLKPQTENAGIRIGGDFKHPDSRDRKPPTAEQSLSPVRRHVV